MIRTLCGATLSLVLTATAAAQDGTPPARAHHALAYDPVARHVLLTAGSTPRDSGHRFEFFDDLWAFDGARWSVLPASGERVSGVRLAFDTRRARMLSWGGFDGSQPRGDLRVLEGGRWRTLGTHETVRAAEPGFAYDSRRDRLVAFGGSGARGQSPPADTWEHDGARWTRADVSSPPPRQAHVMVFDERRGRVVVFGGMGDGAPGEQPPRLGDTWEYDGARWTRRDTAGPSPRLAPGAAYDSRRGVVILFGGAGADGFLGDTWSWDGTTWTRLAQAGPSPRAMAAMAYDAARDRIVLFGGRRGYPNGDLGDTWEWDGGSWRQVGAP